MSGAVYSVVAAPWSCYSYAVSTGEFHRLPLAKMLECLCTVDLAGSGLHVLQIWSVYLAEVTGK
jgi:hypothetical protein